MQLRKYVTDTRWHPVPKLSLEPLAGVLNRQGIDYLLPSGCIHQGIAYLLPSGSGVHILSDAVHATQPSNRVHMAQQPLTGGNRRGRRLCGSFVTGERKNCGTRKRWM